MSHKKIKKKLTIKKVEEKYEEIYDDKWILKEYQSDYFKYSIR